MSVTFSGNCVLNTSTGDLIIRNLTGEHGGIYVAMTNDRKAFATEIKVICKSINMTHVGCFGVSLSDFKSTFVCSAPVPKPTISTWCNAEKTSCLLTCEGNITDDNGPVDFSWTVGDRRLPGNKTLTMTQVRAERWCLWVKQIWTWIW